MSILTLETKKYSIKIDNFEGPLDLLCFLIDKNKMNIYDVNLSEITDQYVDFLNAMEEMNLEIASEFLVMASTLLFLKSKKLLPKQEAEEEEITEEELIRRIIEYKKFKEISKTLKENYNIFSKRFFKGQEDIKLPKQKLEKDYEPDKIPEVYRALVERNSVKLNQNAKNIEKIALVDKYTVADKVKERLKRCIKFWLNIRDLFSIEFLLLIKMKSKRLLLLLVVYLRCLEEIRFLRVKKNYLEILL